MSGKDDHHSSPTLLPEERHKLIGTLNSVPTLPSVDKQLLERLASASESPEVLLEQVQREKIEDVVRLMAHLISNTNTEEMIQSVLELFVMLLHLDGVHFATLFGEHANKEVKTKDPGIQLEKWSWDDGRYVYRAMEAFALVLAGSSEAYVDKWLRSLLRVVQPCLKEARTTDSVSHSMLVKAEASVKALSILSRPHHLRQRLVQQNVPGDLSSPALLPALLFPPETSFAATVERKEYHQLIYDGVKVIWHLSFSGEVLDELDAQCRAGYEVSGQSVIGVLNYILKKQKKEKIIRMVLNVLNNYIARHKDHSPSVNNPGVPHYVKDMISVGMLGNIEMLMKRTFGDADIPETLSNLVDILEMHVEDLSSYSIYAQEVHSSMLEWSPPHTSEKFWRENMKAFENDNYAAIKELAKMIAISKEPLNIQIACHDVGEFVRHHPHGKRVWEKLGIKERVYELIEKGAGNSSDDREAVKRHALLCMQKIMVQRWDLLS